MISVFADHYVWIGSRLNTSHSWSCRCGGRSYNWSRYWLRCGVRGWCNNGFILKSLRFYFLNFYTLGFHLCRCFLDCLRIFFIIILITCCIILSCMWLLSSCRTLIWEFKVTHVALTACINIIDNRLRRLAHGLNGLGIVFFIIIFVSFFRLNQFLFF